MPAVFVGHGNPMNALTDNPYAEKWAAIGKAIPRPKAILCISAHWYISATAVTAMPYPKTIHDFGGFPPELFALEYPAPGDPPLAERVKALLAQLHVGLDQHWGLDHGAWSVLCRMFPKADIPVVQLSIDERQPPAFHYALGKQLSVLRDDGVLVVGSGNVVHNLREYAWGKSGSQAYDWAVRFDATVREAILSGHDEKLVEYRKLGDDAKLSIPTPDHYLPLLYILGLRRKDDPVTFPVEGFDGGSMSMLAVQVG